MTIEVEMTGKDDRLSPWKIAIAGFAGAGKTLFASTAPSPLFVFFSQKPRIKSIADRHIPHVKLTNKIDGAGNLISSVQDQLKMVILDLAVRFELGEPVEYETLVIDTGDELQQAMKESRRIRNRGEWGVGDWVWLADSYKPLMESIIDLPMNVIVLYHMTTEQDGLDGQMYREIALQGANKDQVAGWFDVVAALDTYEVSDEEGNISSQRVLLTHSSRMHSWVKDHSGNLPVRWPISEDFVGDYKRLYEALTLMKGPIEEGQEHQIIGTIGEREIPGPGPATGATVPSPADLEAKKEEKAVATEPVTTAPEPEPAVSEPIASEPEETPGQQSEEVGESPVVAPEPIAPTPEPEVGVITNAPGPQEQGAEGEPPEPTAAMTDQELVEVLEPVGAAFACTFVDPDTGEVCHDAVDEDMREVSQIRFRTIYCRPHFKKVLASQGKGK